MPTRPYHALREREAAFVGVCVVLAVAVLPGAVFRGEVLSQAQLLFGYTPWQGHAPAGLPPVNTFLVDPPLVFYPFLAFATDAVRHGHLPTWSAGLYAGHPFLASFQSAVCSPFMPIAYLLPLPWATVPLALAPLVVGAAGMRRFVRALGSGESASWYAGLAWLLNGFAIVWLEHPLTAVACWLPWILLAVDRIVDHPSPGRAAWLAAAVGASILSGHPETSLKILLFAFAWGVHRGWGAPRRTWALLAGAGVAGVLLAAVQVVPFAEYLRLSEALARRNMAAGNTFVLPPATLVTAIVPDFFGNPAFGPYLARVNRFGIAANYGEQQVYAGAVTALLAPVGLVAAWHDGRSRFFAGAAVVALSLMYGLPGLLDLVSHLPVLRVSILSRFGVVVIASAIVLAARGVDALTGDPRRVAGVPTTDPLRRALVATFGILGVIVVLACGWFGSALAGVDLLARTRHASMVSIAFVAAAALVAWSRLRGRVGSRTCAVALCGLVTVELLAQAQGFHRTIARRDVLPSVPAIDAVRRDTSTFRVYGWGTAFLPDTPMAYGLQDARGWDGVQPARYTRLLDLGYLRQSRDPERHLANPVLLDLLNVKYVFVPVGLRLAAPRFAPVAGTGDVVFENTRVQPRAWLASRYAVMDDRTAESALHAARLDLRSLVLLEDELPPGERPGAAPGEPAGTATVARYEDTVVEIETAAAGRRLLLLADAQYPGWQATVDGQPVTIYRADYALRAVPVPAGRHTVRFTYVPWSVRVGTAVSMITGVVFAAALVPRWRRRRPRA